jgi:hypothetical protein
MSKKYVTTPKRGEVHSFVQSRKLSAGPGGLFKRAAERARITVALYEALNPGSSRDDLVSNLLHDLMHLCDRDATLGDFDQGHANGYDLYATLVADDQEGLRRVKAHVRKSKSR